MWVIKEYKDENQHIFQDKNEAINDHDEAVAHRHQLEEAITKACSELPKLQIQTQATPKKKLQKLAAIVK